MNSAAHETMIPKAPRVPHDFVLMLTYCAGPERTRAEDLAEEMGILDGSTQVDELS